MRGRGLKLRRYSIFALTCAVCSCASARYYSAALCFSHPIAQFPAPESRVPPMKPQLLIDTDPGVDDALAICMAAAHADIRGLTVAAGNTGLVHTVRNACRLVDLLGIDTPVFAGCPVPLVRMPAENAVHVHGEDGFGDAGLPEAHASASAEHAALAIVRLTREQPGALTLVALGPLTNLALAVRLDPELPQRLARLVIMGGAVHGRGNMQRVVTEFNIGFDPEAARVVFDAFPLFDLVDWELCVRHAVDEAAFDAMLAAGDARARFYAAIACKSRQYNAERGRHGVIAADALAMAVALQPEIVTTAESRRVDVELEDGLCRGMTVVDWEGRSGRPANARIVLAVAHPHYERLLTAALGARALETSA